MTSGWDLGVALLAVKTRIITPDQLTEALSEAQGDNSPNAVTQSLIRKGFLHPSELLRLEARARETPATLHGSAPDSDATSAAVPPSPSTPRSDPPPTMLANSAERVPPTGSASAASSSDMTFSDPTATPATIQAGRAGMGPVTGPATVLRDHVSPLAPPGSGAGPAPSGAPPLGPPAGPRKQTKSGWWEESAVVPNSENRRPVGAYIEQAAQPPPPTDAQVDIVGRQYSGYDIVRVLGRGGMGVVYEALDPELGRRVALKILPAALAQEPGFLDRFHQEALATAKLRHPNIVQLYGTGIAEGHHFISMELIDGKSLAEVIKDERVTPRRAARLAHALAEALEYAHANGVIHRDLKPSNVLVGEGDHLYLMDFGLARVGEGAGLTQSNTLLGTPVYMSPEVASAMPADAQADVYGVGVVLYELLTGQPPFAAAAFASVIHAVIETDPLPPRALVAAIPRDLETVTLKAMEKSKARRYHSMTALRADLGRWLEGEPVLARPVSFVGKLVRKARKNRGATALGALALVVLLVALGLWWRGRARDLALAREKVAAFRSLRAKGDASSSRAAYEALAQAITLSGEAEEYLREKSKARMEDVQALMKGEDWKGAEGALELLKEADAKVSLYAKELVDLDRWITGIGSLELHTDPEGATYKIYDFNEKGLWDIQQDPAKWLLAEGVTPMPKKPWPMGDYLVMLDLDRYGGVNYPVAIVRNGDTGARVHLIARSIIPKDMVYIPAGEAIQLPGSPDASSLPVKGFFLGRDEVTQAEYSAVLARAGQAGLKHTPHDDKGNAIWESATPPRGWESLPVFGISSDDAEFYADAIGARLPYRDEFLRAGCGARARAFPWGSRWDATRVACGATSTSDLPSLAGEFERSTSPFGCRNLVGNIGEWIIGFHGSAKKYYFISGGNHRSTYDRQLMLTGDSITIANPSDIRCFGIRIARDLPH